MQRFVWLAVVCATLLVMELPAVLAAECKLQMIPINLVPSGNGSILMALKVDEKPALFMLDTGAYWSVIRRGKIGDLPVLAGHVAMSGVAGKLSSDYVVLPSLSVGPIPVHNMQMFVVPDGMSSDDRVYGVIGANILGSLDVEINLAENKLNFFLPSGCGDGVVYWKNDGFSELDFQKNESNSIIFKMKLNGKNIKAIVDTGASVSLLSMSSATDLFDLRPGMPGVDESGQATEMYGEKLSLYSHRFESLEIDGLKFNNPTIMIADGKIGTGGAHSSGSYDLLLGMRELRYLHMYIAYHAKKIYFTKASS